MTSVQGYGGMGSRTTSMESLKSNSGRVYTAPPLQSTARRQSLLNTLDKERRQSNASRLKGLVVPSSGSGSGSGLSNGAPDSLPRSRRSSVTGVMDLPKIGATKVDPAALVAPSKQGTTRRMSYQSLTPRTTSAMSARDYSKTSSLGRNMDPSALYKDMSALSNPAKPKPKDDNDYVYSKTKTSTTTITTKTWTNGKSKVLLDDDAFEPPPETPPTAPPAESLPLTRKTKTTTTTRETNQYHYSPQSSSAVPQTPPPSESSIMFDRPKMHITAPRIRKPTSSTSGTSALSPVPASPSSSPQHQQQTNIDMSFQAETKAPKRDEIVMHEPVKVLRKVYNPLKAQESKKKTTVAEMNLSTAPVVPSPAYGSSSSMHINLVTPDDSQTRVEKTRSEEDKYMQRFEHAVQDMSDELSTQMIPQPLQNGSTVPKYSKELAKEVSQAPPLLQESPPPSLPSEAPPPIPAGVPPSSTQSPPISMPISIETSSDSSLPAPSHKKQDSFEDLLEMDIEKSPRGGIFSSRDSSNFDSSEELDTPSTKYNRRTKQIRSSIEDHQGSPQPPVSPTPSDTDSGIYSTKAEHGKITDTPDEKSKLTPIIQEEYSQNKSSVSSPEFSPRESSVYSITKSTTKTSTPYSSDDTRKSPEKNESMYSSSGVSSSATSPSWSMSKTNVIEKDSLTSRDSEVHKNSSSSNAEDVKSSDESKEEGSVICDKVSSSSTKDDNDKKDCDKKSLTSSTTSSSSSSIRKPLSSSSLSQSSSSEVAPRRNRFESDDKSNDDAMDRWRKYRTGSSSTSSSSATSSSATLGSSRTGGVSSQSTVTELDSSKYDMQEVELNKGAVGLGFCIEGGQGSPLGDRPILVKRLFKGGAAAHGILQPGDIIVSANGKDFSGLSHFTAWNYLKTLPEGSVKMMIKRKV